MQTRVRAAGPLWMLVTGSLLMSSWVSAQTTGNIGGTVRDTTGAVLPGVSVETSSPALIEKSRTVVTDGAGQYRVVDLPPGTYRVTFTLQGFASIARAGIELTSGFTAPVNAEMQVGDVAETITVSGASPVVDVQNVVTQRVLTRDVLDAVPSGGHYGNYGVLIPGMSTAASGASAYDVGGSTGQGLQRMQIHGGLNTDQQVQLNGMLITSPQVGNSSASYITFPDGDVEETNITTDSAGAEQQSGGVTINLIQKSGGNVFHGTLFGNYSNSALQSSNVDDELAAQGVPDNTGIKYMTVVNPSIGGPLKPDKLWFWTGYQLTNRVKYLPGFYDLIPDDFIYTPDPNRQAVFDQNGFGAATARVTWQVDAKNKLAFTEVFNDWCECHTSVSRTATPASGTRQRPIQHVPQVTWSIPVTNRLLVDAGFSHYYTQYQRWPTDDSGVIGPRSQDENGFAIRHAAYGNSTFGPYSTGIYRNTTTRGAVAYVTGSHAIKVGVVYNPQSSNRAIWAENVDYAITTLGRRPATVTYYATPYKPYTRLKKTAVYAQDQWTVGRFTLNGGVRFDRFTAGAPPQDVAATTYLPARSYPEQSLASWKDLNPRLGIAYDLFGNGRTAFKASASRYVQNFGLNPFTEVNPVIAVGQLTRTWNDLNNDFIPNGDPRNPAAHAELGPSPNAKWGSDIPSVRYDETYTTGWRTMPGQWLMSAGVQHELMPQISIGASYYRRSYFNTEVTDNVLVSPSDFDTYCITGPLDARLPGGGGQQICGLYDIKPAKRGLVDNVRTSASNFGDYVSQWQGFDLTVNARLSSVLLQGGLSSGRTLTDTCDVVGKIDNPSPLYCRSEGPYLTQVKFIGSYTLTWQEIQISAAFQSIPGPEIAASYTARNAQILPSLGRNLSAGATSTVPVNVIEPRTEYGDRANQLDVRFSKSIQVGRNRFTGMVGVYNAGNSNAVVVLNNAYGTTGPNWKNATEILTARLVKFEGRWSF